MQRVLSIFMALCIGLTLSLDVHAKRFGGGKSFGSAPSHQTRQAPQQTQAAPNQAGRQTPAAASGASRWLGPKLSFCYFFFRLSLTKLCL